MIKPLAAIALFACSAIASDPVFDRSVKPILDAQCAACHSTKSKTSGYSVASVDDVISGGNFHGQPLALALDLGGGDPVQGVVDSIALAARPVENVWPRDRVADEDLPHVSTS